MRILVEPSDYVLRNAGDMAMLRVAVSRLAARWPAAMIQVLSDEPEALRLVCPEATPLPSAGRRRWLTNDFLPARRMAPGLSRALQVSLRSHAPRLVELLWRARLRRQPLELEALAAFTDAVSAADVIIVAGMGGITDAFPEYAMDVLDTLRLAVGRRKYVAMVGQGLGPLTNPELVRRARAVLPRVDFIGLRENLAGGPLLHSLGVRSDRVMTTGDDAVEMAYARRHEGSGDGIGVNLRASGYSGVDAGLFTPVREALQNASRRCRAPLLPIPISRVPGEADADTIRHLIGDVAARSEDDVPLDAEAVIARIHRCRLVVTGSYHAAVFALASGIPAIGLARSAYYVDKFLGLAALFGDGCQVVRLDAPDFPSQLDRTIPALWQDADRFRPVLLAEAARQVRLGHEAYDRIQSEASTRC